MKPMLLTLTLFAMAGLQAVTPPQTSPAPTGPRCIGSDIPCFWISTPAPRRMGHIVWHLDGSYDCEPQGDICDSPTPQEIKQHETQGVILSLPSASKQVQMWNISGDGHGRNYRESVGAEGRIDRLSDAEYASLKKLRQAVVDEEAKIAKAHGVDFGQPYSAPTCGAWDMGQCIGYQIDTEVQARPAERYEFRGQFLLVNVPEAGAK